ncbi:DUF433 domain-containing protein [Tautonia rosea]|uniref:DUF433 domain-containing protein n=1 Tax=Tautonia rosea TaxID=2728037 RepID=UPI001472C817|nr:DUF433 domain-containing protein [Tautonia rosea]
MDMHPSNGSPSSSESSFNSSSSMAFSSLMSLSLVDPDPSHFEHLTASLLASVDPEDAQERLLVELLILAAQRLRRASLAESEAEIPDLSWCRFQTLADRNFRAALKDLRQHRDHKSAPVASPATRNRKGSRTSSQAGEANPLPELPPPPPESTPEEIADAYANWRIHIALVRSMSEEWPVILRLRREVEDVAAWLADGKTEEELMTWYPGLTRADIAACRACDAEGLCGPFDPADGPYPPGLPVLDDLPDEEPET